MKMNKKKQDEMLKRLGDVVAGIAGGVGGNKLTDTLEKQTFLGSAAAHSAGITSLVGALIYVLAPQDKTPMRLLAHAGLGMAIVGGTEEGEKAIGTMMGSMGYSPNRLGFTPQYLPAQKQGSYVNNVAVR